MRPIAVSGSSIACSGLGARKADFSAALAVFSLVLASCATPAVGREQEGSVSAEEEARETKSGLSVEEARAGLSGYWVVTNFFHSGNPIEKRMTKTIEGKDPPLKPWAKELYEKRIADAREGRIFADTEAYCVASGTPRAMRGPSYPIEILQTPGKVTILFEVFHNVRHIYMNAEHPPADEIFPNLWGHSIGHWEGDTLVVHTVGLEERTTIDKVGLPHTDQMEVTERIRLTSPDTFEDIITIDDPGAYTEPFSVIATYKRLPEGTRLLEYECADNNQWEVNPDGTLKLPE